MMSKEATAISVLPGWGLHMHSRQTNQGIYQSSYFLEGDWGNYYLFEPVWSSPDWQEVKDFLKSKGGVAFQICAQHSGADSQQINLFNVFGAPLVLPYGQDKLIQFAKAWPHLKYAFMNEDFYDLNFDFLFMGDSLPPILLLKKKEREYLFWDGDLLWDRGVLRWQKNFKDIQAKDFAPKDLVSFREWYRQSSARKICLFRTFRGQNWCELENMVFLKSILAQYEG